MPAISQWQSAREITVLERRLEDTEHDIGAHIDALRAVLAHPCTQHSFQPGELWAELADALGTTGDFDGAIEAMEAAIAHGASAQPDPRADIAEWHLQAGRSEQAALLYARLREESPRDVWLYNNAGLAYADVEDHATAVRWWTEGLEVALADGDPERLVAQLCDLRMRSLTELGMDPDDELTSAARTGPAHQATRRFPDWPRPPEPRQCGHCGYGPEDDRRPGQPLAAVPELSPPHRRAAQRPMVLAVAWFPRGDWPRAIERWPDLLEDRPADPDAYSHDIEAYVKALREADRTGGPLAIAPLHLDEYLAYCTGKGIDPAAADSRASYAAHLSQTGATLRWPPGRNEPCWCDSGRKYKRCCGPVSPADLPSN